MFVIGTAGHVDHGKSALVQALTGIDPDRLKEEKERGLTIDLGFAWLKLPSGREVSIVDVPGHERFIKNMLAGVGGIDLALLVVAADEGVMPQTREHIAIIDLLRVQNGLVVITKSDLVDDDWLELVTSDVTDAVNGTCLEGAQILSASSVTGEGLEDMTSSMDLLLADMPSKKDTGRPRLPIDRAFTISGFGTVVTGTLIGGELRVGQETELVPGRHRCRVRGLQTHKQKVQAGQVGSRVAANLSGVSHDEIHRGQVLTAPGWLRESIAIDVRLRLVPDCPVPVKHNAAVTLHSYTSETTARVRLLNKDQLEPGEEGWAQIRLQDPITAVKGDLFVIRSHRGTLGGGEVVEIQPSRHKRFHSATLDRLEVLGKGSPEEVLINALEGKEPTPAKSLVESVGVPPDAAKEALQSLLENSRIVALGSNGLEGNPQVYSRRGWEGVKERCQSFLCEYHGTYPLRTGAPKEELRSRLGLPQRVFLQVANRLVKEKVLVEEGAVVRLTSHKRVLSDTQEKELDGYLKALENTPYSPPTDIHIAPDLLNSLIEEGKVVRASPDVVFGASAYEKMVDEVVREIKSEGKITVGRVRDVFHTSRKYALALMEYLDQQRVTRRVGDDRVLR